MAHPQPAPNRHRCSLRRSRLGGSRSADVPGQWQKTVANQSQARSDALDTFHRTLYNTGALQYSPALVVGFDTSKPSAQCQSSASVTLLLSGIIPAVTIETRAEALIRFSR